MKTTKTPILLAIVALIGTAFGVQLSQHYYEIRSGMAGFHSFCNISSQMNCDIVAASPAAELFAGFPLSSFVTGWYLAFFVIALLARDRFWKRDCARVLFGMSALGLCSTIFYFLIMAFTLHTYCLFCLGVDAVNVLLFTGTLMLRPEPFSGKDPDQDKELKADPAKWKKMVGIIAASLVVTVVGLKLAFDNVSLGSTDIDQQVEAALAMPVMPLNITNHDPSLGPKSAPITIVEFSDFQCPYCRIGAQLLKSVMDRYPTQVRVVFRPFPWDQSCNRLVTHPMHEVACEVARVSLCARDQGKFQSVYEELFDHQTDLVAGAAAQIATRQGVSADQLAACTANADTNSELLRSIEEGITLGIEGTPTFFVNGHRVAGMLPGPFWDKLIDSLLKK